MSQDVQWMQAALKLAKQAGEEGEVPVGAVVVKDGKIVGRGKNGPVLGNDPTAHAEIIALRSAAEKIGSWRLEDCTLIVTLEPCAMCAGAIAQSRINTLVFGAWDEKAGAVGSVWDVLRDPRAIHKMEVVGGVLEADCAELLTNFFRQ